MINGIKEKGGGKMFYFAYGSNLNKYQMKKRCPDSEAIEKVVLKDYKLVFNRVADIIGSQGNQVQGALYKVSSRDIKNLDAYEGYPYLYTKKDVVVKDTLGNEHQAFVYVMVVKGKGEPNSHYYETIVEGFKDWKLDIDLLKKARGEVQHE